MNIEIYILPALILALLVYAFVKKIPAYTSFAEGAKAALKLCADIFPYIAAIFICVQLFKASGLSAWLSSVLAPAFSFLGIPPELCELILIRPFSGNAGLALLSDIYKTYGADSYVARCASVIVGANDTVFYITAVYFAGTKVKKFRYAIPVALLAYLFSAILACLLLRFL